MRPSIIKVGMELWLSYDIQGIQSDLGTIVEVVRTTGVPRCRNCAPEDRGIYVQSTDVEILHVHPSNLEFLKQGQ